ncbi:MAG TPA: RIP metalloprotease RseP [Flavobacteriales bacterium]|nr:RIP metalloprotease RseP [Flavobacteriales bacterium]|tara:strand:+ start:146 stop:1474 length:1329 start_codon:yes stop_codon:yes gene_type:complete
MEEIVIKAGQLLLSLSILVILHELGHYIPAKLFKTRVEKFYLFFDPWFSIFKKKVGDTEYGVGWLPLGGYVKISGMIDESMDKEQMKKPPQPWEFRSKPAWQRLIIMLGGVTVNVILAFVIYSFSLVIWGEKYLPSEKATYGIHCDSLALAAGFQDGDIIYSIDGSKVERFARENGSLHSEMIQKLILDDAKIITVVRNGRQLDVPFTEEVKNAVLAKTPLFSPNIPFVIDAFAEGSVMEKAGAQVGDRIIKINDQPMDFAGDVIAYTPSLKGDSAKVVVDRNGQEQFFHIFLEEGVMGVQLQPFSKLYDLESEQYNALSVLPAALKKTQSEIANYLKQFKLIKKSPESVGGFISIGSIFPPVWDWQRFWSLTAFLSIMLAVLNLLPIPALDGGHVMFLLYEVVTRRKPNEKVMEYAQTLGVILLLGLVLYANGNDIFKLLS